MKLHCIHHIHSIIRSWADTNPPISTHIYLCYLAIEIVLDTHSVDDDMGICQQHHRYVQLFLFSSQNRQDQIYDLLLVFFFLFGQHLEIKCNNFILFIKKTPKVRYVIGIVLRITTQTIYIIQSLQLEARINNELITCHGNICYLFACIPIMLVGNIENKIVFEI